MSLPTYQFAREGYWIETAAGKPMGTAVLHPLLHSNTSDLNEQRYSSTFTGDEFFLDDYRVKTNGHAAQKMLPGVAYLEIVRAAIEESLPAPRESMSLELRNVVWAQPIEAQSEPVNIALLPDNKDELAYEIFSRNGEQEIIHCQGRAVWSQQEALPRLNIEELKGETSQGRLEPNSLYAACARVGLNYGPSFQAITALHCGNNQILAQLRLPSIVSDKAEDYVLHLSLMEDAVQAAVSLIDGSSDPSGSPPLPLALESLQVISPCSREMLAWVRYAPANQAGKRVAKLDLDLCDERGTICAPLRALAWPPTCQHPFHA